MYVLYFDLTVFHGHRDTSLYTYTVLVSSSSTEHTQLREIFISTIRILMKIIIHSGFHLTQSDNSGIYYQIDENTENNDLLS